MSRAEGFAHADIDTAILDDPKVRALVRATRNEALTARCLVGYVATVTASWARGERVTLQDAAPLWVTGLDLLSERLGSAGLLDAEGRIPAHAWDSWFGPARDRRQNGRDRWHRWNDRQKGGDSLTVSQPGADRVPTPTASQSVIPTGSPVPSRESTIEPLRNGTDPTTCPRCGDEIRDTDQDLAVIDKKGGIGHRLCPTVEALPMLKAEVLTELYSRRAPVPEAVT